MLLLFPILIHLESVSTALLKEETFAFYRINRSLDVLETIGRVSGLSGHPFPYPLSHAQGPSDEESILVARHPWNPPSTLFQAEFEGISHAVFSSIWNGFMENPEHSCICNEQVPGLVVTFNHDTCSISILLRDSAAHQTVIHALHSFIMQMTDKTLPSPKVTKALVLPRNIGAKEDEKAVPDPLDVAQESAMHLAAPGEDGYPGDHCGSDLMVCTLQGCFPLSALCPNPLSSGLEPPPFNWTPDQSNRKDTHSNWVSSGQISIGGTFIEIETQIGSSSEDDDDKKW